MHEIPTCDPIQEICSIQPTMTFLAVTDAASIEHPAHRDSRFARRRRLLILFVKRIISFSSREDHRRAALACVRTWESDFTPAFQVSTKCVFPPVTPPVRRSKRLVSAWSAREPAKTIASRTVRAGIRPHGPCGTHRRPVVYAAVLRCPTERGVGEANRIGPPPRDAPAGATRSSSLVRALRARTRVTDPGKNAGGRWG